MDKFIRSEICFVRSLGDMNYYTRLVRDCVQLARDEAFIIKKIRKYLQDLPEDIKKQYDFRYVRGNKIKCDKFIPYRFIMRRKLNELIYKQFHDDIKKYIQDAKSILRINLDMDVYTMFVKCQKHRHKIVRMSNKVVNDSKRKLDRVRGHIKR